ncbi:MAG: patatin-like phospholipase family protein [Clostridia bacterium]
MRGLVLEGGGVKGAFHIGALTALFEHGYEFDGYVGTSIGAVNAAMLAQGDWQKTIEMWDNITMTTVLAFDDENMIRILNREIDKNILMGLGKTLKNLGGLIDRSTEQLHKFLASYIDESAVRRSNKDFGLVTFSVPDFNVHYLMEEDIPVGQLCDYVIASASYPLFRWQQISGNDGKRFIDGGVYDNMPVKLLVAKGYDDIIIIRTSSRKPRRKIEVKDGVNMRYVIPSEKMAYALEFTQDNVKNYMKMGYYDTKRLLLDMPSFKYCVICPSHDDFYRFMLNINEESFPPIMDDLGLKIHKYLHSNIEDICDTVKLELALDKDTSDCKAFVAFLEEFALALGLERYAIYTKPRLRKL